MSAGGVLFFGAFLGPIFQKPKIHWKYRPGVIRGNRKKISEPTKTGKHHRNRDFKTVLRFEWAKRAKQKLDQKKREKMWQKSPPRKRPRIVGLSARCVFRIFGASRKKRPGKARNHYKNNGFGEIWVTVWKGVFGTEGWGGNLDPAPGGSGRKKTQFWRKLFWHGFPLLKCSVLQREASRGPSHHL